ncbi:MAG: SDR family oxidoreductase [Magnetococcales bacterium]|nr:SDR family oxidoreductase [Magnetococcales bacterium]
MEIQGKLALVTGGSARIGAACVRALSRAGARVVVHCHRAATPASALCDDIRSAGGQAWPLVADLSDPGVVDALISRIVTDWGPLHILVNNAAIFEPCSIPGATWDNWNRHLAINLSAPFFLMSHFVRQISPEGAGKVINLIDQRVLRPGPGHASYTAAKSALWSLTRLAAVELAPRVQVNAIGPGVILPAAQDDEFTYAALVRSLPMQRPGRLTEITDALLFLLGNDYVTGQMLCIDGGQHL